MVAKYHNSNLKTTQFSTGSEVCAYPNPATEFVSIDYELPAFDEVSIEIYDLAGKLIRKPLSNANRNKGENSETISLKDLNNGTYILSIESSEGKRYFKIIKI